MFILGTSLAYNYNVLANVNDNSCQLIILGCTDINAFNYDSYALEDDYSCTNSLSFNYDESQY